MTAYAYRPVKTPIHALGAGPKLGALFGLSLLAFFFGPLGLFVSTALVAAAGRFSRMGLADLLSGSRPLAIATGTIALIGAVSISAAGIQLNAEGAFSGGLLLWGVLVSFCAGSVLFATTTTGELREALARGEAAIVSGTKKLLEAVPIASVRSIGSRLHTSELSLLIALTLAFIPRVFSAWEAAEDAHRARCGRGGVFGTAAILPLAAERLIEAAAETARALEARGYDRNRR